MYNTFKTASLHRLMHYKGSNADCTTISAHVRSNITPSCWVPLVIVLTTFLWCLQRECWTVPCTSEIHIRRQQRVMFVVSITGNKITSLFKVDNGSN